MEEVSLGMRRYVDFLVLRITIIVGVQRCWNIAYLSSYLGRVCFPVLFSFFKWPCEYISIVSPVVKVWIKTEQLIVFDIIPNYWSTSVQKYGSFISQAVPLYTCKETYPLLLFPENFPQVWIYGVTFFSNRAGQHSNPYWNMSEYHTNARSAC